MRDSLAGGKVRMRSQTMPAPYQMQQLDRNARQTLFDVSLVGQVATQDEYLDSWETDQNRVQTPIISPTKTNRTNHRVFQNTQSQFNITASHVNYIPNSRRRTLQQKLSVLQGNIFNFVKRSTRRHSQQTITVDDRKCSKTQLSPAGKSKAPFHDIFVSRIRNKFQIHKGNHKIQKILLPTKIQVTDRDSLKYHRRILLNHLIAKRQTFPKQIACD